MAYILPQSHVEKDHELALTISLICWRELFGYVYRGLQRDYYYSMPQNSGVVIRPVVQTRELIEGALFPGDIDILIIPYEDDDLVVGRSMAIEVKVIRASYAKPGKSPNDMGVSQAKALMQHGFPYAALIHLIVSDESPKDAWRQMGQAKVIDDNWRVDILQPVMADMLPADLMNRAFGRLKSVAGDNELGLAAVYLPGASSIGRPRNRQMWLPECRIAQGPCGYNYPLIRKIYDYYCKNRLKFIDAPKY